jgi:hypothetical protein
MTACSERCGWCGRCTRGNGVSSRYKPAAFTADEHRQIRDGFRALGLPIDYFDFYDIDYLRQNGCGTVEKILDAAQEHADRAKRFATK